MKNKFLTILTCLVLACIVLCACTPTPKPEPLPTPDPNPEEKPVAEVRLLNWNVYLGKGDGNAFVQTITEVNPDVITFQEMRGAYDKFVVPLLAAKPQYVLINDRVGENITCSTPIIFNSDKFELLDFGAEMLVDAYQGTTDTKSLSYAVLEVKSTGKVCIVAGFHGAYINPKNEEFVGKTDEELDEIRENCHVGNVNQVVGVIRGLKEVYGDVPSIFGGDCNFNSQSAAYTLAHSLGYFDAEKTATQERNEDGLKSQHGLGKAPEAGLTIDHYFGDGKVVFLVHKFTRNAVSFLASDHDAVIVDVYLKNN